MEGEEIYPSQRGCGKREDHGLYFVFRGAGAVGHLRKDVKTAPLEYFLKDPEGAWNWGQVRAPIKIKSFKCPRCSRLVGEREREEHLQVHSGLGLDDFKMIPHLVLGVGKKYYPYVPDFVEEWRRWGLSKRIPRNFNVSDLIPGKSQLLLVHPRTHPKFGYEGRGESGERCPWKILQQKLHSDRFTEEEKKIIRKRLKERPSTDHQCLGDLWPLSVSPTTNRKGGRKKHKIFTRESEYVKTNSIQLGPGEVLVKTPSVEYKVKSLEDAPFLTEQEYDYGIFAQVPIHESSFEYVSREGEVMEETKERFMESDFTLRVMNR